MASPWTSKSFKLGDYKAPKTTSLKKNEGGFFSLDLLVLEVYAYISQIAQNLPMTVFYSNFMVSNEFLLVGSLSWVLKRLND